MYAIEKLKQMIFEIKISTSPDLEVFDEPPNKKHKRNETVNIFDFADQPETIICELEQYLSQQLRTEYIEEYTIDPLKFWYEYEHQYPILSKLTKYIFVANATSAGSERIFSVSGRLLEERRTRLCVDNVNAIIFLNSYRKL
jgi:hypothetical protein